MKQPRIPKLFFLSCLLFLSCNWQEIAPDHAVNLPDCLSQDTTKLVFESNIQISGMPKLVLTERTKLPLLAADKPWESNGITYSNVLRTDGKWKMWYSALDRASDSDYQTNLCYAESQDGINWIKPNLKIVEYDRSRNNNIILTGDIHGQTVFYDPNAPTNAKYKMVFSKFNVDDGNWVYGMSSEDGITFKNLVLLSKTNSDTQTAAFFDQGKYRFYLRNWDGGYSGAGKRTISYSETSTFGAECIPTPIEILSYKESGAWDLYNNGISKLMENLYVMFPSVFDHSSDKITPFLAIGKNGINFDLKTEKEFLPLGKGFDSSSILVAPGCIQGESSNEFIFYYSGRSLPHSSSFAQLTNTYDGGIGRFIVRIN